MIAQVLFLLSLLAVPPLTEVQRDQLATARDDTPLLEDLALHALLENVLLWEVGDEAGASIPDYDALLTDPGAGRGELFLIEGKFAGRARRINLKKTGPWSDALTEWVLIVRDNPEQVAVVYLIDPARELAEPRVGMNLRIAGRFYKVWADTDADGNPERYLTFVARSAETVIRLQVTSRSNPLVPILLLIVILSVAYILVRRLSRPVSNIRPHSPHADRHAMLSDPEQTDPARALEKMTGNTTQSDTGDHHGDR